MHRTETLEPVFMVPDMEADWNTFAGVEKTATGISSIMFDPPLPLGIRTNLVVFQSAGNVENFKEVLKMC